MRTQSDSDLRSEPCEFSEILIGQVFQINGIRYEKFSERNAVEIRVNEDGTLEELTAIHFDTNQMVQLLEEESLNEPK